jgi:hypothetical protein
MSSLTSNSTLPAGETATDLYGYTPSDTGAYAYLAVFALSGFIHFIMMFPLRAAFFIHLLLDAPVSLNFRDSKQSTKNKY